MRLLILLRHLPTIHDINDIYTPSDLNVSFAPTVYDEIGQLQTKIEDFFLTHNLKYIYCSDNPRGINSAKALCRGLNCEYELIKDCSLNNILQPEWDNLHQNEVKNTQLYQLWHNNPQKVRFKDGESLSDVERRVDYSAQLN